LQSTLNQKIYDKEGYLREMTRLGVGNNMTNFGTGGGEYGGEGYGESPNAFGAPPTPSFGGRPGGIPRRPGIPGGTPGLNNLGNLEESTAKEIGRLDFVLQFVWKPTAEEERLSEEPVEGTENAEQQ